MEDEKGVFQQVCSQIWWLVLLRGISVSVLGILLLSRPAATVAVIVFFMGIYWLADGVFTVAESLRGRKHHKEWGGGLFVGGISVVAGLAVISQPFASAILTSTLLIYFLAFAAVISGVTKILAGMRLRKELPSEWSMIIGGVLHSMFGLILLSKPLASALIFVWMLGILSLAGGIALVVISLKLRKVGTAVS